MVFTVESLTNGIEQCKKNIVVFEEAIEKEEKTMKDFKAQIKVLKEKEELQEEMASRVTIERD